MLFQNWFLFSSLKRNLQRTCYNLNDFLKGGDISRYLKEIGAIQEAPFNQHALDARVYRMKTMVEYACEKVPFYRELGIDQFKKLPVVNKGIINGAFDSFISCEYLNAELHEVYTSGSTGIPFKLYQDEHKRKWHTASVLYFMNRTNYQLGNLLFELEVIRGEEVRSDFENFKRSAVQFDISNLSEQSIEELIGVIKKLKGKKNILGFSSGLEAIGDYLESNGIYLNHLNFQGIIANSEKLCDQIRKTLESHFGCPVFSRYSNEELGILAQETKDSGHRFELNWSSFYYEILDLNEDKPVKEGEIGRIVVTDLHNYAMPILRYDTGDLGRFETGLAGRRYLKAVEGRRLDAVYNTQGELIASFVIITLFYPFKKAIKQYQFIQTGVRSYVIKIHPSKVFKGEEKLIALVRKEFGSDALVTIEYVDEIPTLNSGKRRKVVNVYHKECA